MFDVYGVAKFLDKRERAAYDKLTRQWFGYLMLSAGCFLGGLLVEYVLIFSGTNAIWWWVFGVPTLIVAIKTGRKWQDINRLRGALILLSQGRGDKAFIKTHL